MKNTDTFHNGYQAVKKQVLFMLKELKKARKKYKSFDDEWELEMIKGYLNSL